MKPDNRLAQNGGLIRILTDRLRDTQTCAEIISGYEEVMRSIWSFTAPLIGQGGTRAVIARSTQVATRQAPLLRQVLVADGGVDFSALQNQVAKAECDSRELAEALLLLGVIIFETLADLSGDVITGPLLLRLEREL